MVPFWLCAPSLRRSADDTTLERGWARSSARCRSSRCLREPNGIVATAEILVDTDVLVDHLRGARRMTAELGIAVSVVTRCELFAGRTPPPAVIRQLLEPFEELGLDRAIAERTGRLRQQGLRIADAIIAATTIEHKLTLVTRNRRHFEGVRGLKLRSPA